MDRTDYINSKRVKGRDYLYFRMPGGKLIPLPLDRKSAEFRRSYDACLTALKRGAALPKPAKPKKDARPVPLHQRVAFLPGSLHEGIKVYLASRAFTDRKPSTQDGYRLHIGWIREYKPDPRGPVLGTVLLKDFDLDAVDTLSEQIAREKNPSAAQNFIIMLSNIWAACRTHKQFKLKGRMNPTDGAERRYTAAKNPHRPWSPEAQDAFMANVPKRLKLAKLLLHFSAQRGGDCVKMNWTDFDGRGLSVRPEKGSPMAVANYHICPKPLRDALLEAQAERDPNDSYETILRNAWGKPWSCANALSHAIHNEFVKLGLKKKGERARGKPNKLTMHGLRKNAASEVAMLLMGTKAIKSVTGHKADAMANLYAEWAEKRALNGKVVEAWDAAIEAAAADKAVVKQDAVAVRRAKIKRVT